MPACGQCGKDNPEGQIYCGFCAARLDDAARVGAGAPASGVQAGAAPGVSGSIPRDFQRPVIDTSAPEKKGGIEWIPWRELSSGQKLGRVFATAIILLLSVVVIRGILDFALTSHRAAPRPPVKTENAPLAATDRKDGIQSLCKVFQIYGLPRTVADADEAAKNAQQLFKQTGNETPDRSALILTTVAREFQSGKLKAADCAAAGEPLGTSGAGGPDQAAP
jgi:hypothetical protein